VGAVEARIARLPDGEDPDSFVRKYGAPALEEILAKATPAFEYFVHELWSSTNQSTDQLAAALTAYMPLISAISDDNKRNLAVHYVAKTLRVDADVVRRGLRGGTATAPVGRPTSQVNPLPASELKVIAILDAHPDLFDEAETMGIGSLLTDARLRDMYLGRRKGKSFLDEAPPDIRHTVAEALHAGHSIGVTNPRRTLHDMWRSLQLSKLDAEADQIDREQKEAERRGNAALARELGLKGFQTRKMAEALKRRPEDEPR
jgi:DNA primase